MHLLQNDFISATFKTKGAELVSLKSDATEYIWQADPKVWGKHAPILFPIIGKLKDDEYTYHEKKYVMQKHGFSRHNNFKVVEKTATSILFEQRTTPAIKKTYPFEFILQVVYRLTENSLQTEYRVKNPSNKEELYFSIGAHPAFSCPFEAGQKRSEYQLIFDKKAAPKSQSIVDGLYTNKEVQHFTEDGILSLPDTLFNDDALTFNPNPFSKVTFVHQPTQKKYLSVTFKNYPYLGIWSMNNASRFICIEPWHGIADAVNTNKEFAKKEGIIKLPPNEEFSCDFLIEILND